jgi:hypothetical protein
MVLGMSLATFTLVHVAISLVGIASGLIVMAQFMLNRTLGLSNTIFLLTTTDSLRPSLSASSRW